MRDGRFQMQAAGDGNGDDLVAVRGENGGKLADAFGVAAPGEADENFSPNVKDVTTFESAGKRNVFECSELGEHLSEGRGLAEAALRATRQGPQPFLESGA